MGKVETWVLGHFTWSFWISFGLVMLLALMVKGITKKNILIDGRGRYSLNHVQTCLWTFVVIPNLLVVVLGHMSNVGSILFPVEVLGLIGVAGGSMVLSGAVKATKDRPGSNATVIKFPIYRLDANKQPTDEVEKAASFGQIWLEEEGNPPDAYISITKFQNFLFTMVVLVIYLTLMFKAKGFPTLPENVVWLIGISHAGYVGGKVPNK